MFSRVSIALMVALVVPFSVFAQQNNTTPPPSQEVGQKAVTVATVNIYNAMMVSQKDNALNISFDIFNRIGIQPQVIYALTLLKKESSGQYSLADKIIYSDDILNLGAGQTIRKMLEYRAPSFLKGTYKIEVEARNPDGLPFSIVQINKEVILNGSGEYVRVDSNNCFLTIEGKPKDKKYTLTQVAVVAAEENLIVHCPISNNFKKTISVTPSFQTRYRTAFGKVMGDEKAASITLAPGENLAYVATVMKKALEPQAYEVELSFLNDKSERISQPVYFNYVLRGANATIQNLTLDKEYYAKGDTAHITFFWTAVADAFLGARGEAATAKGIQVVFAISDGKNVSCATEYSQKLKEETSSELEQVSIPITADCKDPVIAAKIIDSEGKPLAQNSYALQSKNIPTQGNALFIVLGAASLLIAFSLISYLVRKRKAAGIVALFFVMV
ncbi:MAG: hypothetical protein Q8P56_06385, partial [Candidatus Uhrbacteria bacterium]|nr:hypothetical protein [Candidatus Uhrbacteria bacterium]